VALASLEEKGFIGVQVTHDNYKKTISTITQNVDILHSKGGMNHVLHLHGKGNIVRCMECGITKDRTEYHDELLEWNQQWIDRISQRSVKDTDDSELRPDGDAELQIDSYDEFTLPGCKTCGESDVIKTDVVFFGDSIPRDRVDLANAAVDAADGLLCIGTSLAVHSAFRLAKRAVQNGVPVAILNVGKTRAEKEQLDVTKIESPIGETLVELVKILESTESNVYKSKLV
jgi:NAD-dependent deacetylase sirtuin 4